ncbi:diaminopimelate dehydrogenase [Acetivibrio mesophilus]|uniref:Meso-diaminopimelate D-dehydrogenase n=1 Tax=Acetivibrio mesophilus TaxID=2487273 RepID=A0A4Q0I7B5_9FIRM|nr:diaminopimelate dehydrogenase [Acetivibrio mesophilus]ODM25227.1 diaminopimelate dehydrogenase [Clostridium sp. Bc-iso-3]RXE59755.1 diaminopimelate dehydrogenase [Acetivibrio mesophilus]HHV29324.1 diaminopimelate dehydrogenase [Clostridium sp.]
MEKIKIGIVGYGNLGKSAELGIIQNKDMELVGIFTRRNPDSIKALTEGVNVYSIDSAKNMTDKIDVMLLCGGSMSDLPVQGPEFAEMFNLVDGFDTHNKVQEYFESVDVKAKQSKKVAIIACGWDPGMFSLSRLFGEVILPEGRTYTFWGKGVSQGHSDAIRRVKGVLDARQYTIPVESAIELVRKGGNPELTTREKHIRECFVVAEEGADKERIEREIKTMPDYFADYNTIVHFITEEELKEKHSGIPHGGFSIRTGKTGVNNENNHTIEYSLKLGSNPDFTANTLIAYARAAYRLNKEGVCGAKTVFDIPPAYLSPKSAEELRKGLL